MSFILDALKKAESERNRNVAPVLMDARIAPPRRGLPAWAWLLGGVLLANLVVLGWLLWRQPATGIAAEASQMAGPASREGTVAAPADPLPDGTISSHVPGAMPMPGSAQIPGSVPAPGSIPVPGSMPIPDAVPVPGSAASVPGAMGPLPAAPASALPPVAAASAMQPGAAPSTLPRDADPAALPALHELRAAGIALPALQLELHAYDPAPAHRSVLLNGHRLREGEYTPDGVKVERITPVGVVLEAAGRRFRLDVGA